MAANNEIWIVDDDPSIRWVLGKALERADKPSRQFDNARDVLAALEKAHPAVIVTDIRMPDINGIELLEHLQKHIPDIPVVIMTACSDLDSAVSAYEGGAFEYLPKPFDTDEALDIIERAQGFSPTITGHFNDAGLTGDYEPTQDIIGKAPAMQEVFRAIGRLMRSDVTVLVTGESGTGKELVAHALHKNSARRDRPFVALNMAAIPKDLMESELFGHEKGAFTGANAVRKGYFEQADGGTLFLDEIGDMPAELQTRLLRVLTDGTFYKIGGHTPVRVDVRIIAATHQDLLVKVEGHTFREDLYHRLNVIQIKIPALRERTGDIPLLSQHFLQNSAREISVAPRVLADEAITHLQSLPWPGNVRELENTCRWLTVMCHSQDVYVRDLPIEMQKPHVLTTDGTHAQSSRIMPPVADWKAALEHWLLSQDREKDAIGQVTGEVEQLLITAALRMTDGHKQKAASLLGWGRNTLTRKMKAYHLE